MKTYLTQYKPFLIFLLKFCVCYLVLTLIYKFYLSGYDTSKHEIDGFTTWVARQTSGVIECFGYTSVIEPHERQASFKLFVNDRYVARVVEGCNVLSVMILFVTFIVAFAGKWKQMLLFSVLGCLLLYLLNILRIALLAIALYHFPEKEKLLHEIIFPLVIYGIVFVLWIIWVNKYSAYATKNNTK